MLRAEYKRSKVDPTYEDYKGIQKLPYPSWLRPKVYSASFLEPSTPARIHASKEGAVKKGTYIKKGSKQAEVKKTLKNGSV